MIDINLLKQIFGDNVVTISSPEEMEEKMKAMADFFKKVQSKDEEEHDCSKCKMPQNLCFAKPEVRDRFKNFAANKATSSIARILGGECPVSASFISASFSMTTILKYTNPNPEISGLKPTLLAALDKIKEGDEKDEKVVAEVILDLVLLYLWCK